MRIKVLYHNKIHRIKLPIHYQNNINIGSFGFTVNAKSIVAIYTILQEGQLITQTTAVHVHQITMK
jgi:hypothetical protein